MLDAKNIIVWGRNVYVSWLHSVPILREAKARGIGIVGIDPVHHRTAELCDHFWQPRPGGDFALAMAVARVLFERGWTHPDAATWSLDSCGGTTTAAERPVARRRECRTYAPRRRRFARSSGENEPGLPGGPG
jgi:nitrate reductase alpha subunit